MSKILFVGDPHIQVSNLEEATKLMNFIKNKGQELDAKNLVIAGDLFHTHAIIRMEVLNFWKEWINYFSNNFQYVWILVGNHDMAGDKQKEHKMSALDPFKDLYTNVKIVNTPTVSIDGYGFMPYYSNNEDFISDAKSLYDAGIKKLFCHQTFDGSKYDNGFYAPDGIDQNLLPNFEEIISGHIHKEQKIGKVFYPGTPKWDTMSDANEDKGIWFFDGSWKKIRTAEVCTPIYKFVVKEGEEIPNLNNNAKNIIELQGSSRWIKKSSVLIGNRAKIIAKPTDSLTREIRKKVNLNILDYVAEFKGITCDPDELKSFLKERVLNG